MPRGLVKVTTASDQIQLVFLKRLPQSYVETLVPQRIRTDDSRIEALTVELHCFYVNVN